METARLMWKSGGLLLYHLKNQHVNNTLLCVFAQQGIYFAKLQTFCLYTWYNTNAYAAESGGKFDAKE